jgi:hypothetical protein
MSFYLCNFIFSLLLLTSYFFSRYVLKKNKIMYFKSKAGVGQEPLGSIPIKNIIQVKQSLTTDIPSKYEQVRMSDPTIPRVTNVTHHLLTLFFSSVLRSLLQRVYL